MMPAGGAAAEIVRLLDLAPHPEGGWYRETFRDDAPGDERGHSSAIYYLLAAGDRSHWHRVDAVEVWHHYAGAPVRLSISADGKVTRHQMLGTDFAGGEAPQIVVPRSQWQSAVSLRRLVAGRLHGRAGIPVLRLRDGAAGFSARRRGALRISRPHFPCGGLRRVPPCW